MRTKHYQKHEDSYIKIRGEYPIKFNEQNSLNY